MQGGLGHRRVILLLAAGPSSVGGGEDGFLGLAPPPSLSTKGQEGQPFQNPLHRERLGQVWQKQAAPQAGRLPHSLMTVRPPRCLIHPLLSPAMSSLFPVQASSFHSTAAASPLPLLPLPIQPRNTHKPAFPEPASFPVSPRDSC